MLEATELVIKIGVFETIGLIVSLCITLGGSLITIAWKASGKFSKLETSVDGLDTRLTNIESNMANMTKTLSPISLTEKGTRVLEESGLKKYIDENKESLINDCKDNHSIKSKYDIQSAAFKYFDKLVFNEDFDKQIKDYAFNNGLNIDVIRRAAGIYFRDICLNHLKLDEEESKK
ncbi:MAG: hypothetical protein WA092_02770 [Minisyncoccales bacterium]